MIAIGIVMLLGAVAVIFSCSFFLTQASRMKHEVLQLLRNEMNDLRRRAQSIEQTFVETLAEGQPVDPAIDQYQRERAQTPFGKWQWGQTELAQWEREQSQQRQEEINRQYRPKAIGLALVIVALTLIIAAVLYHQLVIQNPSLPFSPATPLLPPVNSPLPPANSNPII